MKKKHEKRLVSLADLTERLPEHVKTEARERANALLLEMTRLSFRLSTPRTQLS